MGSLGSFALWVPKVLSKIIPGPTFLGKYFGPGYTIMEDLTT